MANRTWLPTEYLDETCPPTRATPSDWIEAFKSVYVLATGYQDQAPHRVLWHDDIVRFSWTEAYGDVEIEFGPDGSFKVIGGAIDPRANCVWIKGDADTIDESVQSFAENWTLSKVEAVERVVISQYAWSDGQPFVFKIELGGARFVEAQ